MTWRERWLRWWARLGGPAVAVGQPGDGLVALARGGTGLDKSWAEQSQELGDALEAWRKNPLARRIIGLVTAYVVGPGIELRSTYPPLARFLTAFWAHPQNHLALRQVDWCDELARAGELFIVLHTNAADGMSYVRTLPASSIDRIEWRPGDYECELRYHERVGFDDADYPQGRWWLAAGAQGPALASAAPDAGQPAGRQPATGPDPSPGPGQAPGQAVPLVLHFAVNRPAGCLRGESDLASILPWLRRYSRWLEDRVRLNAAVRTFLWVVRVPGNLIQQKQAAYARPPEAGSVLVIDKNSEEWEAVAPRLNANDAQADGRAIRWMVVAGGPGLGLVDMGEAETSNLATAAAMGEQRWRFMRQRQAYFGYVLALTALTAYNRAVALGRCQGRTRRLDAIEVGLPDVSSSDNASLGAGAHSVAQALEGLQRLGLRGESFQRLAARLVFGFAGETLSAADLAELLPAGQDAPRGSVKEGSDGNEQTE